MLHELVALRHQLLTMMATDQTFVMPDPSCSEQEQETINDREIQQRTRHAERLKQIIAEHGWPSIGMVGLRASTAAWLIAQHADHDLNFQRTCRDLMQACGPSEVRACDTAYLIDRVLMQENKPQRYGTQLMETDDGSYDFYPIEHIETVDERRAEVGLGTLTQYRALHEEWQGK